MSLEKWRRPIFEKNIYWPKNGQNWAQNAVFGHFLELANFAYDDEEAWYLTRDGGLKGWNKYLGQIWAKIGQISAIK